MKHVVMFSGGVASWCAARRVAEAHGTDNLTLLFTDTKTEDEDTYRFLREAAADVGGNLVTLADGRDVWQVFYDVRFIGNSKADPCSRILKRELARKWVTENVDPSDSRLYVGMDWAEEHRMERTREAWKPWAVEAPLQVKPYLDKVQMLDMARARGLTPPALYAQGFPHANCGGFCIKAGHAQFAHLLRFKRETYLYHERREQGLREYLQADVSVLKDRRGGKSRPLTLRAFRERVESGGAVDLFDWGGCGCFVGEEVSP